jgi:hypothetical protein
MTFFSNGDGSKPTKLAQRLSGAFLRPAKPKDDGPVEDPNRVLPENERRAAVSGLNPVEVKWAKGGLTLTTILGIVIPIIESSTHPIRKVTNNLHGKNTPGYVFTSGTWLLIGVIVVLFCGLGFLAVRRRKRSLVVFTFFILGFSFVLIFQPLGFALILLGAWLLLRAHRIQKFGTANAKLAAKQTAATRTPRRERKQGTSTASKPAAYKAPTANKRYTPKAAPRKKVAKPVE